MRHIPRKAAERGNSMIELALCMTFLVPLVLGSMVVGIDMGRSLQVSQVARDTAHMFARSTDFSLPGTQDLVVKIAAGLGMTRTGGNGVVILSRILQVGDQQCTDGGVSIASCTNRTRAVVTQRIVIGNTAFAASKFATPTSSLLNSDGTIDAADYLKNSSVVATNFSSTLPMLDGDIAYMVECYFQSAGILMSQSDTRLLYARSIF